MLTSGGAITAQKGIYKEKLINAGISVIIPDQQDIEQVNDIIYNELCLGIISVESKEKYLQIIEKLSLKGAQGVILGCTEIGLLVQQKDTALPVFDTAQIHAYKAAMQAVEK